MLEDTPLYYGYGYLAPGAPFVRAKVGKDKSAPLLLVSHAEALNVIHHLPERSDAYLTALGYTCSDLDDENQTLYGPLYLDLDNKAHPDVALQDTRNVVTLLRRIFPDFAVAIHFSGSKGFHVEVDPEIMGVAPHADLHLIYRLLATELANATGVKDSFDAAVYDRVRLWRTAGTWNSKGGCYKTALSMDELLLLDIDQIKQLAATPRPPLAVDREEQYDAEKVRKPFIRALAMYEEQQRHAAQGYSPREIRPLPQGVVPPCVQKLSHAPLKEGDGRNRALWVVGTHWRKQGWSIDQVGDELARMNKGFEQPVLANELSTIVKNVADNPKMVGCRTPELSAHCDGHDSCVYFQSYKPTPDVARAGMQITDIEGGFAATQGEWLFHVTGIYTTGKGLHATVKAQHAGGYSRISKVNTLSPSAWTPFTRNAVDVDRTELTAGLHQIGSFISERAHVCTDTQQAEDRKGGVKVVNGCYTVAHQGGDGSMDRVAVTNFTFELRRLLYELGPDGTMSCVREVVFIHENGSRSHPHRAGKSDLATVPKFTEFCNGAGNYSFTGSNTDLQRIKEYAFMSTESTVDEAYNLHHIGFIDPAYKQDGLYLAGNIGVMKGQTYVPDEDMVYTIAGERYQLNGLDASDLRSFRGIPILCTDYLNKPNDLHALKARVLDDLLVTMGGYQGWVALGIAYASVYLPEIVARFTQFPGLCLVGPMGSGKSTLARWIIWAMGLKTTHILNMPNTTLAAMDRTISFFSGLPVVLDEFRNTGNTEHKVDLIRSWYDRNNRSISPKGSEQLTISRPVRGWTLVSGQDISTDAAFNSRFVTLVTANRGGRRNQDVKLRMDETMRNDASAILLDLLLHKTDEKAQQVCATIERAQYQFQEVLSAGGSNERTAFNYACCATGIALAFEGIYTSEQGRAFRDFLVSQGGARLQELRQMSEGLGFIRDIASLRVHGGLIEGVHWEIRENMKVRQPDGTTKYATKSLVLWYAGCYSVWEKWCRGNARGNFSQQGIHFALRSEPSCLTPDKELDVELKGNRECGVERMRHRVMVFDLYALGDIIGPEWGVEQHETSDQEGFEFEP